MPVILNKDEFEAHKHRLLHELKESIFIYPTDTIYGIGCNALNEPLVHKVREIKQRHQLPFSILAPSKEWIRQNCVVDGENEKWLEKLPGPYTLILKLKKDHPLPQAVNMGLGTVGVRIPNHWFSSLVAEMNIPIVTTSANLSGEDYMKSLDDLNPIIKKSVSHIIYEGELNGRPSTIIRLDGATPELRER